MKNIDLKKFNNIDFDLVDNETLDNIIVKFCYYVLVGELDLNELNNIDRNLVEKINLVLNYDYKNDNKNKDILKLKSKLDKLLRQIELSKSDNFSLDAFLNESDYNTFYKHKCSFNGNGHKAAIALIFPDKSLYANVPIHSNHADMVTEYMRNDNPKYENLAVYHILNNGADWHDKIMVEEQAIIIHFLPNEFGEVVYIPDNISEYQYNELININNVLKQKGIEAETNYCEMLLNDAIEDPEFISSHCNNVKAR